MTERIQKNLIAKTGSDTSEWLSLTVHLCDTAEMMKYLVRKYASPSFADSCGLTQEMLEDTAVFLAAVHDIGKASIGFQFKISRALPELRSRLEHCGLHFPDSYDAEKLRKTPHGLAGEVILLSLGCPKEIAAVVGAHHGVPCKKEEIRDQKLDQPYRDIVGKENYFGKEKEQNRPLLEAVWRRILEDALRQSNFSAIDELPNLSHHAQVLLTGLLIMADWLASNTEYFPLMYWEDDAAEASSRIRAQNAWDYIDFTAMWKSGRLQFPDAEFEEFFGFMPNSVQQAVVQALESAQQPGIMILEAPMGCGKTEAALAAAELMPAKLHKNGLFFGLPTQATANGIFPRILDWCEQQSVDEYHSIQLRHGGAALNESFQQIQRSIPDEETDSGMIVHRWFCNPKQACLAEFVVATVDHLLMMALKRKHLMLLHLGLSQKVVIVDECHAYDAYMNQYLERALQWLGAYHTPVILLSATLPAKRRMALVRAYLNLQSSDPKLEESFAYPLLTWTDGTEIHQQELPYHGTHRQVRTETGTLEEALPHIILLLRLAAPLQAWGGSAKFEVRTTQREPTKSGVIGMLAAALGRKRDADLSDLAALRFGIRVEREGRLLRDFHTAHSEDGKASYVTERYYLSDAVFLAALESEDTAFLEMLAHVLEHPVYPLFLGRRSCPPTLPLLLGIREGTLMQVLRNEPKTEQNASMRIVCDAMEDGVPMQDMPISFSPLHRQHGFRTVQEEIIFSDEHDPMAEL